jgi:gamma-glutamyltranspeptidase
LLGPARLAARRKKIGLDRTHAMPRFELDEHGTHALCIADAAGNMVSLTTTVNREFGAKVMGGESGVVLNDELDDFTAKKAAASFGLRESPNHARAGARPVSSMTPVIVVRDGAARFALGGSGGLAIAGNVTQVALGLLAFDQPPDRAVGTPRIFTPLENTLLELEPSAAPLRADLERRGEIVGVKATFRAVQVVASAGPTKLAASDPRKHGSATAE